MPVSFQSCKENTVQLQVLRCETERQYEYLPWRSQLSGMRDREEKHTLIFGNAEHFPSYRCRVRNPGPARAGGSLQPLFSQPLAQQFPHPVATWGSTQVTSQRTGRPRRHPQPPPPPTNSGDPDSPSIGAARAPVT